MNNFTFDMSGIRAYYRNKGSYNWHNYVTKAQGENLYIDNRLIVPIEKKTQILDYIYKNKLVVPSIRPFYDYVKERYYGISVRDVEYYIKSKPEWQYNQNVNQKTIMPVIYYEPGHFQVDLTVFQKKIVPNTINYLMNCIDIYSHYAISIPLQTKDAITTSEAIKPYLKYFKSIQTDNGKEFLAEFHDLLIHNDIQHIFSKTYRWQTQGLIERFNGTIKRYLKMDMIRTELRTFIYTVDNNTIQKYVDSYNHNKQRTLGYYTPYELFFINDYDMRHARLKIIFDKLKHFKNRDKKFVIGDKVRLKNNKKSMLKYSKEVYIITDIIKPNEPWQSIKYVLNDNKTVNGNYLLKIP